MTAFVTEFRHKDTTLHETEPFELKCQIMSDLEIHELLEEFVTQALGGLPTHPEYDERKKDLGAEEFQKLEDESKSAFATLNLIFPADVVKHVEKCTFKSGYLKRLLTKLSQPLKKIQWPSDTNDSHWSQKANTIEECQEFVSTVMKHELSPFIKVMKIYLDSPILASGVVLADIPGFRDTNGLRVRAALKYTAQCDGLFVVNSINRIVSNLTVLETIRTFRRLRPRGVVKGYAPTITVVATSASQFNNLKSCPPEFEIDQSEGSEYALAKKAYEATRRKELTEEVVWTRLR